MTIFGLKKTQNDMVFTSHGQSHLLKMKFAVRVSIPKSQINIILETFFLVTVGIGGILLFQMTKCYLLMPQYARPSHCFGTEKDLPGPNSGLHPYNYTERFVWFGPMTVPCTPLSNPFKNGRFMGGFTYFNRL